MAGRLYPNSGPTTGDYSQLQDMAVAAIRKLGETSAGTVGGDVMPMMRGWANEVIDEVLIHPYHDGSSISYYASETDVREVPDAIIEAGLLARYARQQRNEMAGRYEKDYNRQLNTLLYQLSNLPKRDIALKRVDGEGDAQ